MRFLSLFFLFISAFLWEREGQEGMWERGGHEAMDHGQEPNQGRCSKNRAFVVHALPQWDTPGWLIPTLYLVIKSVIGNI